MPAIFEPAPWAVQQLTRHDRKGLIEDVCRHGVGHPNKHYLLYFDPRGTHTLSVHGCDGCCYDGEGRVN